MKKIDGFAKSVSEILKGSKYSIDYYQREYKWETKQIQELVNDLTGKFIEAHNPLNSREMVEQYPYYFLGSIIISEKKTARYIVDGQQRLTSLTLLLTFLRSMQKEQSEPNVEDLILSEKYGKKSFNLEVADRKACMTALYEGDPFDSDGQSESVRNLYARYMDLAELFPAELLGDALPFFIDWLQHGVQIVQITAYTDDDAYSIFETMNDRGLKLTPSDMLKGYLLANITNDDARIEANDVWRKRLLELTDRQADADSDFFKAWFRSQYASKIRERKKDARPEDYDKIGTEFHRWLRAEARRVGLAKSDDFYGFIKQDFDYYSLRYLEIEDAATIGGLKPGKEYIAYVADHGFSHLYPLLLAPLNSGDSPEIAGLKMELVSRFADTLLAWRIWNYRSIAYSTMQYAMFLVMRDIRGVDVQTLARKLHATLLKETETFAGHHDLRMNQQNRLQLHRLIARITDYIGVKAGEPSRYLELTNHGTVRYEVEHIWANHPEDHANEFEHAYDFGQHRNLIGDLLLLPKSFNASYCDDPYTTKLTHYYKQNLLAASLNPQSYQKNPGFVRFVSESELGFRAHETFTKADVVERGELYREIAQRIWNPEDILRVATNGPG